MSHISVGSTIKARFGMGGAIKNSKVLAVKPGPISKLLIESFDGITMGTVVSDTTREAPEVYDTDTMCSIGGTGYTREKAAKTLGFKDLKLK